MRQGPGLRLRGRPGPRLGLRRGLRLGLGLLLATSMAMAADIKPKSEPKEQIPLETGVVDKVIASLDGEPVTLSDLRQYVHGSGDPHAEQNLDQHDYMMKALHEYLLGKMLEKESANLKITISDDEVKAYIEEIKRQNNVDEAGFENILKEKGLTLESYSAQVHQDILRSRVVHKLMRAKITVSSEDINRYFEDHPDRKPTAGTVRLHQYGVPFTAEVSDDQKDRARQILADVAAKIKNGTPAQGFPDDVHHDLGYVRVEELRSEYAKAVSDLAINVPSEMVMTDAGAYVFVVTSRVEKDGEVDEALREEIKSELLTKQYGTALDKFLNDELPKKYTVEFKI